MAKGVSIHVGLNHVDPDHYEGWEGTLAGCENDAKDMLAMAKKRNFGQSTVLLNEHATADAVKKAIAAAAASLSKGDLLLLTYSGHGGQVRDTNHDEAGDRMDETWVCYDRQLVDDELFALWSRFKPGVRVLVLSDSCHSGTVARDVPDFLSRGVRRRAMPRSVGVKVEKAHARLYREIQRTNPPGEKARVKASVLLISGCLDNQFSSDGDRNGLFTETLKKVWNGGKFSGDYRRFRDVIVSRMPETQTPNYFFVGAPDPAYQGQAPFQI